MRDTGLVRLYLVDAPATITGLQGVRVVFSALKVNQEEEVEQEEDGWITLLGPEAPLSARTFELMELVGGISARLAELEIPVGLYGQTRLIIAEATVNVDGTDYALRIPSGSQTGIKLVGGFQVLPGGITELVLDFDVGLSLQVLPGSHKYQLTPVVRLYPTAGTGSITGSVGLPGPLVQVTAYPEGGGDPVASTFADDQTGIYLISGLAPGTYEVEALAEGFAADRLTGIVVGAGILSTGHNLTLIALPPI